MARCAVLAVVGDEVLGTDLLAATFVSLLTTVRGQRAIE